ncbi:hypothetical protein C8F01DRAFT_353883 [Mycena amicta]|nr:hypothetical protein C8F01DRAFT_353883 [Mycena amicta]
MNSPIDVDLGSRECPVMISDSDDSDDSARSVENQLQQVSRHTSINPTVVDLSKEDDEPDELLLQSSPRKSSAGPSKIRKRETPSAAFKSRKKRRFEVLPSTPPARAIIELDSDSDSSENDFKRDSKRGNDQSTNTTQRDAELQDAELEDEYEHTTMLEPYRHPTSSFDAPELELETLSIEEVAPRPSSNRLRFSAGSGRSLPTVPNASIREERNRNSKLSSLRTLTKDIRTYKPHGLRFGKRTSLVEALDMDHYVRNYAPVRASGSINKIIQHNGRIVACSNSAGGNETGSTDAYNKAGTLISWSKRKPAQVCDLEQAIHDERTNDHDTYYSVNCVAYDPDSSTLLCSGQDRFIWGWRYNEDEDQYSHQRGHGWYYDRSIIPHDIAIKPGTSVFAVAEKRLSIHRDVSHLSGGVFQRLSLATTNADAHVTGSIAWGSGPSSDLLFAMTEPDNRRRIPSASAYTGQHSAFDALAGRLAFEFLTGKRQGEEGDAMCVSTDAWLHS